MSAFWPTPSSPRRAIVELRYAMVEIRGRDRDEAGGQGGPTRSLYRIKTRVTEGEQSMSNAITTIWKFRYGTSQRSSSYGYLFFLVSQVCENTIGNRISLSKTTKQVAHPCWQSQGTNHISKQASRYEKTKQASRARGVLAQKRKRRRS